MNELISTGGDGRPESLHHHGDGNRGGGSRGGGGGEAGEASQLWGASAKLHNRANQEWRCWHPTAWGTCISS